MMTSDPQHIMRPALSFGISPQLDIKPYLKKSRGTSRDPGTHRIIEKRRRDRMNNCLASLSAMIPRGYIKQGQGRIEKTEIIEMAITHIKNLENTCKINSNPEQFISGYKVCCNEVKHFMVDEPSSPPENLPFSNKLVEYLQEQLDKHVSEIDNTSTPEAQRYENKQVEQSNDTGYNQNSKPAEDTSSGQMMPTPISMIPVIKFPGGDNNSDNKDADMVSQKNNGQTASESDALIDGLSDASSWWCMSAMRGDKNMACAESVDTSTLMDDISRKRDSMDCSKQFGVYKYKNDMKQRFIGHNEKVGEIEENNRQYNGTEPSQSGNGSSQMNTNSDTMSYQSSELSSNGNGCNGYTSTQSECGSNNNGTTTTIRNVDLQNSVPGFALHPSGTYYIPIVTPSSQLMPFIKTHQSMGVLYPISIPVNFGGPYVSMQNVCTPHKRRSHHRSTVKGTPANSSTHHEFSGENGSKKKTCT